MERGRVVTSVTLPKKVTWVTHLFDFARPSFVPLSFRPEQKENFTFMVAAIGSGVIPPRTRHLVGDFARLPAKTIPRWGTVTVEWPGMIASASLTRASPTRVVISMGGVETEIALAEWPMPSPRGRQRGVRMRFVCLRCGSIRDALHYLPEVGWGCRGKNCLVPDGLTYACRHKQKYCRAIARRDRFRRRLIRTIPGSLKAKALRKMIAREERAVLAHLERVNRDLAKRSERDARHRRTNS